MIAVGATGALRARSVRMQVDESNRVLELPMLRRTWETRHVRRPGRGRIVGLAFVALRLSYARIMKPRSWRTRLVLSLLLMSAGVACGRDDERRSVSSIQGTIESGTTAEVRDLCFRLVGDESAVTTLVGVQVSYDPTVRPQPGTYVDQMWCSYVASRTGTALRIRVRIGQAPSAEVADGESQDGGNGRLSVHRQGGDLGVTAEIIGGCNYDTGECAASFPLVQLVADLVAIRDEAFNRIST